MNSIPITQKAKNSIGKLPVMQEVTIDAAGKIPINIEKAVNNVQIKR
tara:strand:- start:1411 stop:1551 length:141 start_codon:yes stop_codon:yes gene_type:complete